MYSEPGRERRDPLLLPGIEAVKLFPREAGALLPREAGALLARVPDGLQITSETVLSPSTVKKLNC